jgi:hypothetical protein
MLQPLPKRGGGGARSGTQTKAQREHEENLKQVRRIK